MRRKKGTREDSNHQVSIRDGDTDPSAWQRSYDCDDHLIRYQEEKYHLEFIHFFKFNTNLSANIW